MNLNYDAVNWGMWFGRLGVLDLGILGKGYKRRD